MATNQYGGSTNGLSALIGSPNANIGSTAKAAPAKAPAKAPAPAAKPAAAAPTPVNITPPSNNTSSNSSSSATAYDPNAVAYYNDVAAQLTKELTAAQGEQDTGVNNINQAFNDQLNQLNQGETNAETSYNNQDAQNGQTRESNMNTIAQGARGTYDSLMKLLTSAGSGVSSAAKYNAPQDVSLNATQQRGAADTTFNTNAAAIDAARKNTKTQYGNSVADLNSQKNNQIETFMSNLLGEEANLEQGIGAAKMNAAQYGGKSYAAAEAGSSNENNAVNNIEDQLSSIFKTYATPTFSVSPVTASTPNLTSYSYDPTSVKASSDNPSVDSSLSAYLPKNVGNTSATAGLTTGITAGATA